MTVRRSLVVVLYLMGGVPMLIFGFLSDGVARLFTAVSDAFHSELTEWRRQCRIWAGLTPDGKTPEQVAAADARREAVLAEMRQSGEWLPLEGTRDDAR